MDKITLEIEEKEKLKKSYEENIKKLKENISRLDTSIGISSAVSNMAYTQMNVGDFVLGASVYNIVNSDKTTKEQKKEELQKEIDKLNNLIKNIDFELKDLNEELADSKKKPAEFVVEKDIVYIKGDKSKIDLLLIVKTLNEEKQREINQIKAEPTIKKYLNEKETLEKSIKTKNYAEATEENINKLKNYKYGRNIAFDRKNAEFDYITFKGKIFVTKDFASKAIDNCKEALDYCNQNLSIAQQKIDEFKPSGIGKIIKSVGQKQQDNWNESINRYIKRVSQDKEQYQIELENLEEIKKNIIEPQKDMFSIIKNLYYYQESYSEISSNLRHLRKLEENIENSTILSSYNKSISGKINTIIPDEAKKFLDDNNLIVNPTDLTETLKGVKGFENYNKEIQNFLNPKSNYKSTNDHEVI